MTAGAETLRAGSLISTVAERDQIVSAVAARATVPVVPIAGAESIGDHDLAFVDVSILCGQALCHQLVCPRLVGSNIAVVASERACYDKVHVVFFVSAWHVAAWVSTTGEAGGDVVGVPCVAVSVAGASNARAKAEGSSLPRFAARRSIPTAAFADSQYLRCGVWVSKTADNEHASATLRDSEVARVQYRPRHAVPEVIHIAEDLPEVTSASAG
jgi:hypothetical protein